LGGTSWSDHLLSVFGLDDEPMPRIVGNDEVVGSTTAFGGEVPVGGIVVDQQAALLAEACFEPGTAKCTFGTGAFLLANAGKTPVASTSGLATSVAWRVGGADTYCIDGQVYTAASAIRWLKSLGIINGADELDSVATADAGGVMCVPALAGLAAPWWRPQASAVLSGMTLSTGRGDVVLAVLQGIAAQIAELATAVEHDTGLAPSRMRVDGGLTRSRVLMQATADIVGIPVDVYPSPHATALGAAALARLSLQPGLNLRDVVAPWVAVDSYKPRWDAARSDEFRSAWRDLASTTYRASDR
jgi:glycerol kinase